MFDDDEKILYDGEYVAVKDLSVDELNAVIDEFEASKPCTDQEEIYLHTMVDELRATVAHRRQVSFGRHADLRAVGGNQHPMHRPQLTHGAHRLGDPRLGRPLALGPKTRLPFVFHQHPLKGWVREYPFGSSFYFDPESKVQG